MIRVPYSVDFFPPAPILQVSLALPDRAPQIGPIQALIDTGADGTFVPTNFLEQLDTPVVRLANVRSHLGDQRYRVALHKVDFVLAPTLRLSGIEVISDDWEDQLILGRNILNKLTLLLDGLKQHTRVSG